MNYGLYLSAAGALTNMHRQDVMANNLANVATAGFKPDDVAFMTRLPERINPGALTLGETPADPQLMLERLGGGQWVAPSRIDLRQGPLQKTGNDLDLAIAGEGFFVVSEKDGRDAASLRLTRDGRFSLNADGELVMAASGHRVLDDDDEPIELDSSRPVTIASNGDVIQGNEVVASIGFVNVRATDALRKDGDNLLRFNGSGGANARRTAAAGQIKQGHIEASAVDAVIALNNLMNASKAVQANLTMMQYHDHTLNQVINTYGRVA